jgi:hypothetical protein
MLKYIHHHKCSSKCAGCWFSNIPETNSKLKQVACSKAALQVVMIVCRIIAAVHPQFYTLSL